MSEADLKSKRNLKSYNDAYLLMIIDILNNVWVELLRDKTSNRVIKVFQHILAKSEERVSINFQTDKNKELPRTQCRDFLKKI